MLALVDLNSLEPCFYKRYIKLSCQNGENTLSYNVIISFSTPVTSLFLADCNGEVMDFLFLAICISVTAHLVTGNIGLEVNT